MILFASGYFFIIYFYICSVNTDCVKDMQTLLNDIELDIQELKCLIQSMLTDTNPVLRIVAKRNIHQMQERLDALTKLLDDTFVITPVEHVASDIVEKTTESEVIS